MQSNVWIITILTNILMVTCSNGERPKRGLFFMKRTKANHFLYNTNNAIMKNYIKIPHLVPNYQVRRNVMSVPFMNQNIYQELFPQILIPGNMVIQPVIYFRRPYMTAFKEYESNYKTTYPNFYLSPVLREMQGVTPLPNFNNVEVPLVRHNDGIAGMCRKNVSNDKAGKMSSALSKLKSSNFPRLSRNTEEISNDINDQKVAFSQYRNIIEIPNIASRVTERKIQPIKSSSTYPNYTINLVQTTFSKAETSPTTEMMPINTSKKFQELVVTLQDATTSPSPLPLSVKKNQKNKTLQPMFSPVEKKNEEINSTSTKIAFTIPVTYMQPNDMSNNINLQSHSNNDNYKKVNSNKSNEDTVFKVEDIKFSKNVGSQDELMLPPSLFTRFIDVLNNIDTVEKMHNPSKNNITQDTDDTLEKLGSNVMEINNHPTDNPSNADKPTYDSHQEEGSLNKTNESEDFFRLFLPSDSDREISRGDIPDDVKR